MASKPVSKRRRNALAASMLVSLVLAPMAARADSIFDMFSPAVSPYAVQNNLARSGFVAHSAVVRRGDVYLVDASDRAGVPQRLIIDAQSGRIVERYSLRPSPWEEARRPDVRPRMDASEWSYAPRPEVDVPVTRPKVIEAFPSENPPMPPRVARPRQLAYGDGHAATPPAVYVPETKSVEKPKPKVFRPRPVALPVASDPPQTTTVAPSAIVQPSTPPQATEPAQQPVAAEPTAPATTGLVASSGTAETPVAKAPQPAPPPAPAAKSKAINDIPVAPLD